MFSGDGGGAGSSPVSVTGTVPVQTVAPTATRFVQSIQGGRKRRALSHETRPRRLFLTAAVGIGQAVRPRFPRHAPACSGANPSLVLRPMSPGVLCCCLAFISRTKSSAVRRCLLMESPHRVSAVVRYSWSTAVPLMSFGGGRRRYRTCLFTFIPCQQGN